MAEAGEQTDGSRADRGRQTRPMPICLAGWEVLEDHTPAPSGYTYHLLGCPFIPYTSLLLLGDNLIPSASLYLITF